MAHLLFKDVNKVFHNGYHAVHDFNMEIKDGEFICLVGDSGCGKSTTLRMIAGLEDITAGEFLIDGKRANEMSSRDRGIAMVFQSYALYPHLTVAENLGFGLTLEGIDADLIDEKVQATAKILGLTEHLDKFPRNLSAGQCLRVSVGRVLIRKVNVFLMDDPISNLDTKQRIIMRSELKQIHRSVGATTIFATRDKTEAMAMADRIVVMKSGGYVQQIGTPYELYFYPKNLFVAGFIGEPPMNFIRGYIKDGKFIAGKLELDAKGLVKDINAIDGKEVVLAFRPEAVKLPSDGKKGFTISSKVELTELPGDTSDVYTNVAGFNVILKINPKKTPQAGSEFKFVVPTEAAYIFDSATGKVIESDLKRY